MRALWLVLALMMMVVAYVACDDPNLVENPSFDQWCGQKLCNWTTDEGRVERVKTWHRGDYGVSFEETPTQISQLSRENPARCMRVDLIADVATSAAMTLAFDFNADGVIEHSQAVPAVSWRSVQFLVHAPADYASLRYVLRKSGRGHAVIAQLRVVEEYGEEGEDPCAGAPLQIADGAACTVDASCASGVCIGGLCRGCAELGSCEDGAACSLDEQCSAGACTGSTCRACGATGCEAATACDADAECASGACVPSFAPSRAREPASCLHCDDDKDCGGFASCDQQLGACNTCQLGAGALGPGVSVLPKQCAGCVEDADCSGGACTFGVCSSCRSDADCAAGESCRSEGRFDFGPRACRPVPGELPRGALCTRDTDCTGGLRCGGPDREPARCGVACESEPAVCGEQATCLVPGLFGVASAVERPYRQLDAWSTPAGRVATCFPLRHKGEAEQRCELHHQCQTGDPWPFNVGACCEGGCAYDRGFSAVTGACKSTAVEVPE
jgi:Cys-rich repeat protein